MTTMPSELSTPRERTASQAAAPISKKALWAGRVMSGIALLFLTWDASMKLLMVAPAVEGTQALGYPVSVLFGLGVTQAIGLVVYLIPRTSVLGAVLWTGYLGGAVATHVRLEQPLFTHILFPTYVAILLWGGLWFREPRLRGLLPVKGG